jgi:host factor-I protein
VEGGVKIMTTNKTIVLQDVFLNQVRKERIPVTIYLTNGFQLRGSVKGFDSFTVILDNEGRQMLVYKHAISTITPARGVSFAPNYNNPTMQANYSPMAQPTDEKEE